MATVEDIIARAYRKPGITAQGKVPDGVKGEAGLRLLQSIIMTLPGLFQNAQWVDAYVNSGVFSGRDGVRVHVTPPGAVVLPVTVTDLDWNWSEPCFDLEWYGYPFIGWTQAPKDLSRVQVIGGVAPGTFVYVASRGSWAKVNGLTMQSDFPFGEEDEEGLVCQLATSLVEEYGGELNPRTAALAQQSYASFRARFKKLAPVREYFRDYY